VIDKLSLVLKVQKTFELKISCLKYIFVTIIITISLLISELGQFKAKMLF
jgi:hypothetical protein